VSCVTCHDATDDPHLTGKTYEVGSFPLRVPHGANDQAYLEKSSAVGVADGTPAGKFGVGNACVWCHKSRKDVTNYITASQKITSTHWGPHEGPHAEIYSGKGGYHYSGMTYANSSHQAFTNGCVRCHMPEMPDIPNNLGIGNHSFYAQLSSCTPCHANATDFDVGGGQSAMMGGIQELRVALNDKGWLTRSEASPYLPLQPDELGDQDFHLDESRPDDAGAPATPALTAVQAGALYNYFLLARGSAGGIHNPIYTRQLIFDSVKAITGNAPATIPIRP
jgi:hypothetical protein